MMLLSLPSITFASGLVSIFGLFPAGVVAGILISRNPGFRVPHPEIVVVVATVLILFALGQISGYWRLPLILLAGLLIIPISQCTGPVGRTLSWRPIVFLGYASYAIYMVHDIVLRVMRPELLGFGVLGEGPAFRLLALLAMYAAVIGFGVLTYLVVERPAERFIRGRSKPRVADTRAAPAEA